VLVSVVPDLDNATPDDPEDLDGRDRVAGSIGQEHVGLIDDCAELAIGNGVHESELDVLDGVPHRFDSLDGLVPAQYVAPCRAMAYDLVTEKFVA